MKLIIAGSRTFDDYGRLCETMDSHVNNHGFPEEVVSGGAKGADRLGELWAAANKIPVKLFPADWGKHGKRAGFIRNLTMANYGDYLIVFWDCKSKGTKNMVEIAKSKNLQKRVVSFHP